MLRTVANGRRSLTERTASTWLSAWNTPAATAARAININLVVVFVFALTALVFLTHTAVSSAQIDYSVEAAINPETSGIAHDTRLVRKLDQTVAGTEEIARLTEPFPGYLSDTLAALHSIRGDSASTDDSVASIERSVRGIDSSVAQMERPVGRLADGVGDIRSRAGNVSSALSRTADLTTAMSHDIASTNTALARILHALNAINPVADGIGTDLQGIAVHTRRMADNGVVQLGNVLQNILNGLLGKP